MEPVAATLSNWFDTPLGQHLLQQEMAYFDAEVADVFGFHAFQLGLGGIDFLRASRMPLRAIVGADGPVGLRADLCELPIATGEADLVVLPHALEFSPNPHQMLREVQRVLRPEGRVVLSGFNPWSLWGATRTLRARAGEYPWCGQFISLSRIKDWLALLGFELAAGRMAAYSPPCRAEKWLHRWRFMESAGDRWWPIAGGVYFLHAVKRVNNIRLITPQWKRVSAKKKVLAAVPHRVWMRRASIGRDDSRNHGGRLR